MKLQLLILTLVLTPSVFGQIEPAPNVAQCEANSRLWLAKLESPSVGDLPDYWTLSSWVINVGDCLEADSPNELRYYQLHSELSSVQHLRLMHFLDRHKLWQQFTDEDTAGKR